ncbi:Protein EFFECTOR OF TRANSCRIPTION 2 [Cardamine amara subsp. amara]|uniref:Protein EFFECTOR OF TRANSCRIPTION 2 n=1 Tax=Cardamine amara subsp. amara TaxID=228776 RepID=A0ABD0ZUZ2_CARAN
MAFILLSKMVKSKINNIRHTISSMQKRKTIMLEISQLLNNRLIVPTLYKREDYKRSKHDNVFSPWRILIESNDWEDFKNGKEGVRSRYRVQNLPRKSCTGIYELGPEYFLFSRLQVVSDRFDDASCSDSVCGVILEDGGYCNRSPVKGRTRCLEHKWQRVSPEKHRSSQPEIFTRQDHNHKGMRINAFLFLENIVKDEKSDTDINEEEGSTRFCEATTKNGLPCARSSPKGSKRCWQHKEKTSGEQSPENIHPDAAKLVACGVKRCNGLICERSPVKGRKRCEEHKGMRICPS